ncbi:TPA: diphthine synthase [archaeon]|uniref:Diphthine synthase n=1 Tax=Candidatus Undinarchaeum marinum TaxID=2756141 RepID=A0A832ULT2_9ARCH|nr:diphthine synthase [Candidatus Undinarchaeum marinum]
MIKIIGIGLWDERSMTIKAQEEAADCDIIYAEFYTSKMFGSTLKKLEKKIGKEIQELSREEVESGKEILKKAKKQKVGLLVGGDAMTATTHAQLILDAAKAGVESKIIHGVSIFSAAAGLSGLQSYKFGKTVSIPFEDLESPYNVIEENQSIGAHTLCLLDIRDGKFMTVNEAIRKLLKIEKAREENVFMKDSLAVGIARAGSPKPVVKAGTAEELLKKNFGEPLHVLIIPGKLHFAEEGALELLKK